MSFYTIAPRGLPVFDRDTSTPGIQPVLADNAALGTRIGTLRTLAEATDGLAIVNTRAHREGLERIAADLTSYYLIGYQSTNPPPAGASWVVRVVAELGPAMVRDPAWLRGGTAQFTLKAADGAGSVIVEAPLAAGAVSVEGELETAIADAGSQRVHVRLQSAAVPGAAGVLSSTVAIRTWPAGLPPLGGHGSSVAGRPRGCATCRPPTHGSGARNGCGWNCGPP